HVAIPATARLVLTSHPRLRSWTGRITSPQKWREELSSNLLSPNFAHTIDQEAITLYRAKARRCIIALVPWAEGLVVPTHGEAIRGMSVKIPGAAQSIVQSASTRMRD